MSKVNDIMLARNQGILYALDKVQKDGIAALEEEVRYRGITKTTLSKQEVKENFRKVADTAVLIAITSAISVLQDEYYFTDNQINKFTELYQAKVNELSDDTDKLAEQVTRVELKGINIKDF